MTFQQEIREDAPTEHFPLLHRASLRDECAIGGDVNNEIYKVIVSHFQGILTSISMGCALCVQTANMSLVTTIQSPIADELDAHDSVSWFVSVYLIAVSCILPLAGRLCWIFTIRRYILGSTIIFVGGQVVTSLAPSLAWFLCGRAIAGIGAASTFPIANMAIINLVRIEQRGLFMGLLNSSLTIGVSLGAVIAGAIEPEIGWRAVFAVQIPIALVSAIVLFFVLPDFPISQNDSYKTATRPSGTMFQELDLLGVFALIAFIPLFFLGVSAPSGIQFEPLIISLVFLVVFVTVEARYANRPVISMHLLRSRALLFACLAILLMMMSRWAVLFFSPIYATAVHFWSPAISGATLFAANGDISVGSLICGVVHVRRTGSFYLSTSLSMILFAAALYFLSMSCSPNISMYQYLVAAFINGFFTGTSNIYCLVHLLHRTDPNDHFVATAVLTTFRGFASPFAASVGGGVFARVLRQSLEQGFAGYHIKHKEALIHQLLGSPRLVEKLHGYEKNVAVESYSQTVKVLLAAGTLVTLFGILFQALTGWKEQKVDQRVVDELTTSN